MDHGDQAIFADEVTVVPSGTHSELAAMLGLHLPQSSFRRLLDLQSMSQHFQFLVGPFRSWGFVFNRDSDVFRFHGEPRLQVLRLAPEPLHLGVAEPHGPPQLEAPSMHLGNLRHGSLLLRFGLRVGRDRTHRRRAVAGWILSVIFRCQLGLRSVELLHQIGCRGLSSCLVSSLLRGELVELHDALAREGLLLNLDLPRVLCRCDKVGHVCLRTPQGHSDTGLLLFKCFTQHGGAKLLRFRLAAQVLVGLLPKAESLHCLIALEHARAPPPCLCRTIHFQFRQLLLLLLSDASAEPQPLRVPRELGLERHNPHAHQVEPTVHGCQIRRTSRPSGVAAILRGQPIFRQTLAQRFGFGRNAIVRGSGSGERRTEHGVVGLEDSAAWAHGRGTR
mmetsp:Transcript_86660/g.242775  ORF Transcript_86660/g.242775 Transcript_86660/m.242775 type:complete len:391 (-) Transcript_86660:145-1317(-)